MRKFAFSLQALLDVRIREEKNLKSQLYAAKRELLDLEEQLELTEAKKEKIQAELKEISAHGITSDQMHTYYLHMEVFKRQVKQQMLRIRTIQNECDKLMDELIEIRKMIKMLETLKDQKYQDYLKDVESEELKLMDDFINSRVMVN